MSENMDKKVNFNNGQANKTLYKGILSLMNY